MADAGAKEERVHWWADCTPRDWRNMRRFLLAGLAWMVSFVAGASLLRGALAGGGWVAWMVAAVPALTGLLVLITYRRYLLETDEFQRMVHYQALALGCGGGWLAVGGYRLFELVGAPRVDRGAILLVMTVVFTVGILLSRRRYA